MSYAAIGTDDEFDFCPDATWNVIDNRDNVWCADECPPGWEQDAGPGPEDASYCLEPAVVPRPKPPGQTAPEAAEAAVSWGLGYALALGAVGASLYYYFRR